MINNSNNNNKSNGGFEALLSSVLGGKMELSKENAEKINNIIKSLSEEDINKIKSLASSGQLQKVADSLKEKK